MGIMLGGTDGLIIRNCYFRNQPDSGSHDEGGIDFENGGNGCLIDRCTFENNAGAAIEVLGLKSPQTTNIEIRDSRFIQNNTAKKLGPSEIFIWGGVRDPSVCCSTGTVQGNGYVLLPGIEFFVNEAPELTSWTLRDNTQYATAAETRPRDAAQPPAGRRGRGRYPHRPAESRRSPARVRDDGKPRAEAPCDRVGSARGARQCRRSTMLMPPRPTATFEQPGDYLLRLVADDGQLWLSDMVAVHILPAGQSVAAAWEFNSNLDKEGWTEVNPGTRIQQWAEPGLADHLPSGQVCRRRILRAGDRRQPRRPPPLRRPPRNRPCGEGDDRHPLPEPHARDGNAAEIHDRSRRGLE